MIQCGPPLPVTLQPLTCEIHRRVCGTWTVFYFLSLPDSSVGLSGLELGGEPPSGLGCGPEIGCETFTDGQRLGAQHRDWIPSCASMTAGRASPTKECIHVYKIHLTVLVNMANTVGNSCNTALVYALMH